LRKTGKVGLAQLTIVGREWLVAVAPLEDGLIMEMLRYADELREPAEYYDDVPSAKPDKEMIDLAVQLIEKKSSAFDPKKFQDHYGTALKQLVHEKLKGHKIVARDADARPRFPLGMATSTAPNGETSWVTMKVVAAARTYPTGQIQGFCTKASRPGPLPPTTPESFSNRRNACRSSGRAVLGNGPSVYSMSNKRNSGGNHQYSEVGMIGSRDEAVRRTLNTPPGPCKDSKVELIVLFCGKRDGA
jgi:hypothetical protein